MLLAANLQLKPSLRRREKLAGKVGRREIYPPVPQLPSPLIRTLSMASSVSVLAGLTQWRGRGARPLFLDQNEARRAEKNFFRPPPPYLRVWLTVRPPPPPHPPYLKVWVHYCDCTKSCLYSFLFLASCDDDLCVKLESPVLN